MTASKATVKGRKAAMEYSLVTLEPGAVMEGSPGLRSRGRREWAIYGGMRPGNGQRWGLVLSNLSGKMPKDRIEDIRESLKEGLKKDAFDRLAEFIGISQKKLAEVIGLNLRTLTRRSWLAPDEADRLLRVGNAFHETVEVMERLEAARQWFTSPKRALGRHSPLDYCDTEIGSREVTNLLGRIEYGVYS